MNICVGFSNVGTQNFIQMHLLIHRHTIAMKVFDILLLRELVTNFQFSCTSLCLSVILLSNTRFD